MDTKRRTLLKLIAMSPAMSKIDLSNTYAAMGPNLDKIAEEEFQKMKNLINKDSNMIHDDFIIPLIDEHERNLYMFQFDTKKTSNIFSSKYTESLNITKYKLSNILAMEATLRDIFNGSDKPFVSRQKLRLYKTDFDLAIKNFTEDKENLGTLTKTAEYNATINEGNLVNRKNISENYEKLFVSHNDVSHILRASDLLHGKLVHLIWPKPTLDNVRNTQDVPAAAYNDLMNRLNFQYVESDTTSNSHLSPDRTWRHREGVCDEFASTMYYLLEGKGFDCYYVSMSHEDEKYGHAIVTYKDALGRFGYFSSLIHVPASFNTIEEAIKKEGNVQFPDTGKKFGYQIYDPGKNMDKWSHSEDSIQTLVRHKSNLVREGKGPL